MRNLFTLCLTVLLVLTIYYASQPRVGELTPEERKEIQEFIDQKKKNQNNPLPDPKRKVHHFDWETNKYVYEDEMEPKVTHPPLQPGTELPYLPDYAVEVETPTYIIKDGIRYKVKVKPNGTLELREWR